MANAIAGKKCFGPVKVCSLLPSLRKSYYKPCFMFIDSTEREFTELGARVWYDLFPQRLYTRLVIWR